MDASVQASLIVALSDLQVVRLLRDAIRTTALSAGGVPGPLGTVINQKPGGGSNNRHGGVQVPALQVEPRPVLHPTPRIERRFTIHPRADIEPLCPQSCEPPAVSTCYHPSSPIQPPWKVRLWDIPIPPKPYVKLIVHRTDVINKGTLIDMFL